MGLYLGNKKINQVNIHQDSGDATVINTKPDMIFVDGGQSRYGKCILSSQSGYVGDIYYEYAISLSSTSRLKISYYLIPQCNVYERVSDTYARSMVKIQNWNVGDIIHIACDRDYPAPFDLVQYPSEVGGWSINGYDMTITDNCISNSIFSISQWASCLSSGTKVHMADSSLKNIEDIVVGDKILSWNENTNFNEEDEVISAISFNMFGCLLNVTIGNEHINTTSEHIYRSNDQWKPIKDIKVGDKTFDKEMVELTYDKITPIPLTKSTPVYCIETKKNHTYYIGERGIITHNY